MTVSNVQITQHFSLYEMTHTENRGLLEENTFLGFQKIDTLTSLCGMLELVRVLLGGHPLSIHSGFRCPTLNQAIGGAAHSQHMSAQAADFHVLGLPLREAFDRIRHSAKEIQFGQLILEGHNGVDFTWIHISLGAPWRAADQCGEILTFDGKVYRPYVPAK